MTISGYRKRFCQSRLQSGRAFYAGDDISANPDVLPVRRDVEPPFSADSCPLSRHIGRWRNAAIDEPLGNTCIQAACNRVFETSRGEGANFEIDVTASPFIFAGGHDTDPYSRNCRKIRPYCQNVCSRFKKKCQPSRAVIHPLCVYDSILPQVQASAHPLEKSGVNRSFPDKLRRCKSQPSANVANTNETGFTLLDDIVAFGASIIGEPNMAGSQSRVSGERKLSGGRENPHPVIGIGNRRAQKKGRFTEVRPSSETQHRLYG